MFSCIDRCEQLRIQLDHLTIPTAERTENDMTIEDLPLEIQDKILLTLNSLKDFDALSQATPMFGEIASEYEHVSP